MNMPFYLMSADFDPSNLFSTGFGGGFGGFSESRSRGSAGPGYFFFGQSF